MRAGNRGGARRAAVATPLLGLLLCPGLIRAIQILTIDTNQVSFSSPTATDYDNGYVEKLSANTLTVDSDVDWKVTIAGTATEWTCTGVDCWSNKPRADTEWQVSGGSYASLPATPQTVTTGTATAPGTEDIIMDYRVLLDWTLDSPGTYDYNDVQYVLSAL